MGYMRLKDRGGGGKSGEVGAFPECQVIHW